MVDKTGKVIKAGQMVEFPMILFDIWNPGMNDYKPKMQRAVVEQKGEDLYLRGFKITNKSSNKWSKIIKIIDQEGK